MNTLIVLSFALSVATCSDLIATPLSYNYGYYGPQHLPIINHEGVPIDTPDVQLARAAHLTHKTNVHLRNGDFTFAQPLIAPTPVLAHSAILPHALLRKRRSLLAAPVLYTPQHLPIINGEGVPVDTADVQIARAAHLIHKSNIQLRNGDLTAHPLITPVLAHSQLLPHALLRKRRSLLADPLAYHISYPQHLPIINQEGVPVDTAEVQFARAAHFAQKTNVHLRNGDFGIPSLHALPLVTEPWRLQTRF